ncbi:peptidoglycan-binding protein [Ancylobacter pratisalsi]|uniref:Peptidoglycan binding-like domain-containing protein n=1 Tax=Ancylobacter pratisalsi TaxID=1745854 RepID=A0A6P1YSV8_9HYPH|nr:peptidoglycan-binding protein [Ancylobacter pratisalsi]QIB34764.1 hypothetical protein G3A50_14395 [Ancylobacter pratisalsi]
MAGSVSILRQLAPQAAPALVTALGRTSDLEKAGITTPLRLAHFLAQMAVETGGFTRLRESGRYSAKRIVEVFGVGRHSAAVTKAESRTLAYNEYALFERVYGTGNPKKAAELGNRKSGDGYRYRGGGAMQNTGRASYARIGLEDRPERITTAEWCLVGAFEHWTRTGCNALADQNDIQAITHRINGGYNGYAARVAWFNKIWPLVRTPDAPAESWQAAGASESTRLLQSQLNQLGYDLKEDGRIGKRTTAAVEAFQKANGLTVDGIAGSITKEAIRARLAGTAPATGSAAPSAPGPGREAAIGVPLAALGEGGQRLISQADILKEYAGLSDWIVWGAGGLTAIGVTIVTIGIVRTYVVPAIWPKRAPVAE